TRARGKARAKPKTKARAVKKAPAKQAKAAIAHKAPPARHTPAKKASALARLKTGVGNLFARMTGRAATPGDAIPVHDRTIEIVTEDIIVQRTKPPPPPAAADTSED